MGLLSPLHSKGYFYVGCLCFELITRRSAGQPFKTLSPRGRRSSDFKVSVFSSTSALTYVSWLRRCTTCCLFIWKLRMFCTVLSTSFQTLSRVYFQGAFAINQKGRCGKWPPLHSWLGKLRPSRGSAPCLISPSVMSVAETSSWLSRSSDMSWLGTWFAAGQENLWRGWLPRAQPGGQHFLLLLSCLCRRQMPCSGVSRGCKPRSVLVLLPSRQ